MLTRIVAVQPLWSIVIDEAIDETETTDATDNGGACCAAAPPEKSAQDADPRWAANGQIVAALAALLQQLAPLLLQILPLFIKPTPPQSGEAN